MWIPLIGMTLIATGLSILYAYLRPPTHDTTPVSMDYLNNYLHRQALKQDPGDVSTHVH